MRSISFEHQTGLLSVMGSSSLGLLGSATSFDEFLEDSLIIGGSSTVGTWSNSSLLGSGGVKHHLLLFLAQTVKPTAVTAARTIITMTAIVPPPMPLGSGSGDSVTSGMTENSAKPNS